MSYPQQYYLHRFHTFRALLILQLLSLCVVILSIQISKVSKGKWSIAVSNWPDRYGNTHAVWDHSITCHLAEVTFPPLPQLKLVLD